VVAKAKVLMSETSGAGRKRKHAEAAADKADAHKDSKSREEPDDPEEMARKKQCDAEMLMHQKEMEEIQAGEPRGQFSHRLFADSHYN
jgi:hypothetical protein